MFMATNITNLLNNLFIQSHTIEDAIQNLFELATSNTIENCKKDFHQAHCYRTPCPTAYWGYGDFRTAQDKHIEKICEAAMVMAHALALPIKRDIDYYDLICYALPNTSDLKMKKAIYSEILRYTESDDVRDYCAEQLTSVNNKLKAINCIEIASSIHPMIINLSETLRAWDILHHQCDAPYNPVKLDGIVVNDNNVEISITGYVSTNILTCKKITFKFYDAKSFSYEESAMRDFPVIFISDFEEKGASYKDCFTFRCGDALCIRAKRLETIAISITEEPLYNENQ